MMPRHTTLVLALTVTIGAAAPAGRAGYDPDLPEYRALSGDHQVADAAIADLRGIGPEGITKLLAAWGDVLESDDPAAGSVRARLAAALDRVGAQRDNSAARLYWYTDLDKAMAAAKATGRPILSLRLLGRLDDELSCANSRFMRTALYANAEVSGILRDRFILHWQSVRPVPKISIDFGDGRSIVRTITGNSLHYVLDGDGNPIDALPGLYGPGAFTAWLQRMQELYGRMQVGPEYRPGILRSYHEGRILRIAWNWQEDLQAAGQPAAQGVKLPQRVDGAPDAEVAAALTMSKAIVESPILQAMRAGTRFTELTSDPAWELVAQRHRGDARLDRGSLALMACKTNASPEMVEGFERSIALDTVRNEYLFHRQIHDWFANRQAGTHQELTERIYAELFLTPGSDPWLGLVPADGYAALQGNGIVMPGSTTPPTAAP